MTNFNRPMRTTGEPDFSKEEVKSRMTTMYAMILIVKGGRAEVKRRKLLTRRREHRLNQQRITYCRMNQQLDARAIFVSLSFQFHSFDLIQFGYHSYLMLILLRLHGNTKLIATETFSSKAFYFYRILRPQKWLAFAFTEPEGGASFFTRYVGGGKFNHCACI